MPARRNAPIVVPAVDSDSCSLELRRKLLGENPLFQDLSPADLGGIPDESTERGFEPGEAIVREGDRADRLFIVACGIVELTRATESGGTVLIDVLTGGEYFGSLAGFGPREYEDTAVARSGVCVLSIGAADKLGFPWKSGKTLIQAPLAREELASMAATTTETARRVVNSLHKRGFVKSGRVWLALADEEALRALVPDYRIYRRFSLPPSLSIRHDGNPTVD